MLKWSVYFQYVRITLDRKFVKCQQSCPLSNTNQDFTQGQVYQKYHSQIDYNSIFTITMPNHYTVWQ